MKDMNTKLQAAFLYFLNTCCLLHHRVKENADALYKSFKQCMRRCGLFTHYISQDEFEAMLEYSGFIKSNESGSAIWEGISLYDHYIQATYNYFEFPQIFIEKIVRNPEISDDQNIDAV